MSFAVKDEQGITFDEFDTYAEARERANGLTEQTGSFFDVKATGRDDASLGVGHVWTNIHCPAYKSYDPADCVCRGQGDVAYLQGDRRGYF